MCAINLMVNTRKSEMDDIETSRLKNLAKTIYNREVTIFKSKKTIYNAKND